MAGINDAPSGKGWPGSFSTTTPQKNMRFVVVVLRDDGSESLGNARGTTFRGDSDSGMAGYSGDCGDQMGGREFVGVSG